MSDIRITPQDILEWKQHPLTKALLEDLKESREEVKEGFVKEKYIGKDAVETSVATATAIGGVRVLDELIEQLSIEEPEEGDAHAHG